MFKEIKRLLSEFDAGMMDENHLAQNLKSHVSWWVFESE